MNAAKQNEELLREAAAFGDYEGVKTLVELGADINAQHSLNGWTALHWAAKRGHSVIVQYLLEKGANPTLKSLYGESALAVAKNEDIRDLLSGSCDASTFPKTSSLPITPNYLTNPPLAAKVQVPSQDLKETQLSHPRTTTTTKMQAVEDELVLKVRVSDPPDQDFIEIEIPLNSLTYEKVFKISCEELQINPKSVFKLRKLPNTILRKDKDIKRLQNFQEIELVTSQVSRSQSCSTNSVARFEMNGVERKNPEILQSPLAKSSFCKNGTILY